jgi:hypothetical protein
MVLPITVDNREKKLSSCHSKVKAGYLNGYADPDMNGTNFINLLDRRGKHRVFR